MNKPTPKLRIIKRVVGKCDLTGRTGPCVVIQREGADFELQTIAITQLPSVLKLLIPLETDTKKE